VKKMLSILFAMSFVSIAHAAVVSESENTFTVFPITSPSVSETYYGVLNGFPHTYEFTVESIIEFEVLVSTAEKLVERDDLSIIVIKEEKRGVSEIGRVTGKEAVWSTVFDQGLALTIREGTPLKSVLEEGVYRLEVSTPDNNQAYQLKLNGGSPSSYGELFIARSVFGFSYWGIVLVWQVYIPLLLIMGTLSIYWCKKRKHA
jgi:hypothetical protein